MHLSTNESTILSYLLNSRIRTENHYRRHDYLKITLDRANAGKNEAISETQQDLGLADCGPCFGELGGHWCSLGHDWL